MTATTRNSFRETDQARIERRKRIVRTQQEWNIVLAQYEQDKANGQMAAT